MYFILMFRKYRFIKYVRAFLMFKIITNKFMVSNFGIILGYVTIVLFRKYVL